MRCKKGRNGRLSAKTSVEDEIAHLRGLGLGDCVQAGRAYFKDRRPLI
jgi:hypothetical protein